MPLAALLALTVLAAHPARTAPPRPTVPPATSTPPTSAPATSTAPNAPPAVAAPAPADTTAADDDGVPPGAPTNDYLFVAWCYGATDEYLDIYERVKPDLRAIDKLFGSSVKEAEPYQSDVADEHKALKRFAAAITAAEKASVRPIGEQGAEAMNQGRQIWRAAELQPSRKLADAWLFWGIPNRCEKTAAALAARSVLMGQALAKDAPQPDQPAVSALSATAKPRLEAAPVPPAPAAEAPIATKPKP